MTGSVIVTDRGFSDDDWTGRFVTLDGWLAAAPDPALAPDLAPADDVRALLPRLGGLVLVRIAFPGFSDGRGFTQAARLRRLGYGGRLRAQGHVLADQYAMVRRAGFDEVEISPDLARRQPQAQWLARADWRALDYRSRLAGRNGAFQPAA
ncbi:MAG: DUF934 domain-containing protein [Rhodobacteraceae bacterium]|jgi:uncharacterized protein (DUF934 family)|nr:DUF934 domain-containing protein [Paracoccaceae bacterium]